MRAFLFALVLAAALTGSAAAAPPHQIDLGAASSGWLGDCALPAKDTEKFRCYAARLLAHVEAARDPARELPRIDARVRATGGFLEQSCHILMHEVGRKFASRHGVTLANLQSFIPRSNNPNCSAGFGMGLIMYLGPKIARFGGAGAADTCLRLPTRYRSYTCIHGLGHAYMRAFHSELTSSLGACRPLGRHAADCAQGVFHDHWISLSGYDGTTRRPGAETSARTLCGGERSVYVQACWYRFFLERPPGGRVESAEDVAGLCAGLDGLQRQGCIGAASLIVSPDPFEQMRVCAQFRGADAVGCVRGIRVPGVAGRPKAQVDLIQRCATFAVGAAQRGCYDWLGQTLAVVTDGAFVERGCEELRYEATRARCAAAGRRMDEPLVTFS